MFEIRFTSPLYGLALRLPSVVVFEISFKGMAGEPAVAGTSAMPAVPPDANVHRAACRVGETADLGQRPTVTPPKTNAADQASPAARCRSPARQRRAYERVGNGGQGAAVPRLA